MHPSLIETTFRVSRYSFKVVVRLYSSVLISLASNLSISNFPSSFNINIWYQAESVTVMEVDTQNIFCLHYAVNSSLYMSM